MNKIVINPHNCSREEYNELLEYLEEKCWDFFKLKKNTNKAETIKDTFGKIIDLAEDVIEVIPQKGNTSSDCQKINLQRALNEFSYVVNGIETGDLISDSEIESFKEEWGQSNEEACSNLGYDEEGSEDLLMVDFFWDDEDDLWLNKDSSLFTKRDKQIADYLRHK